VDGHEFRFLIADRSLVESDIQKGILGDFFTEQFLYPHQAILNLEYLHRVSVEAMVRVAEEEARDLALEHGEMVRGMLTTSSFFGLSRMRKLARVSIPSMSAYLRLLEAEVRERNLATLNASFREALSLSGDAVIELEGDYASLRDSAVDRWLKDRASEQVVNILRQSQRAVSSYLTRGRAVYLSPDLLARELYTPLKFALDPELDRMKPENPKDHIYLRTSEGLVPFNSQANLEQIILNLNLGRPVTISPLAGVLNEVSLVTAGNQQLVAKTFTDWHGFKWFTLNIVSLGTKLFAVSGKTRMTNEYGVNRYLAKRGVKVPEIVYVSVKQRILVERYIPGLSLLDYAKEWVNQPSFTSSQAKLTESLGETLGVIHASDVCVGDAKPENFIAKNGEIFALDLEQAGKHGDKAWDVAELLFYAGHYSIGPVPTRGLTEFTRAFVRGYLRKGEAADLRRAAGVRYAKVFSIWTPAPVIFEITRILHDAK
jgi:tRNA A-37 threonylcarbamoyl transferase component Bud32